MRSLLNVIKKNALFFEILLVLIITTPAFLSILGNYYFSMHDNQHIARLYLLDQAVRQGYLYPRWVDTLGFNFGYPLFNFYPPLIYFIAEFFHLIGFSFISSIKLMIILGFFLSGLGVYYFTKKRIGVIGSFLSTTLYTYFFYRAVLVYVRGAFAEFFTLAILPFIFLTYENLWKRPDLKNSIFFGIVFSLLVVTHPIMAFPTLIFLGLYTIFFLSKRIKNTPNTFFNVSFGAVLGLSLSAFFWLPSMVERKFTILDKVFITELSNFKLNFICPQQFFYSPWGYGGSIPGCFDGLTFQLGKIHIFMVLTAVVLSIIYLIKNKFDQHLSTFYFLLFLLFFSLFMTTEYSLFIWERINYLSYLQFPWRFLTFAEFFIAVVGGYAVYFIRNRQISIILTIAISLSTILTYQKYFYPQRLIQKTDAQLTTSEEVAWRVSRSSFDFVPRDVATKKSDLNTTLVDIDKDSIVKNSFEIVSGEASIIPLQNKFSSKKFAAEAAAPTTFRLNTFYFPGWNAYLDSKKISIRSSNKYRLITVDVPKGKHELEFVFEDTPVRRFANYLSLISLLVVILILLWNRQR